MQSLQASLGQFFKAAAPILPYLVPALILWLAAKKGNVAPVFLFLTVLAGVILAGSALGPTIHSLLHTVSFGYLS